MIAELNIGVPRFELDDPRMAGFMDNLDRINALAERSPGFVWRMTGDGNDATDVAVPGEPSMISNLSVWESVEDLGNYVFNTVHGQFYKKRDDWFPSLGKAHFVMWPIEAGHLPTLQEAMDRLHHLRAHGSTPDAFGGTMWILPSNGAASAAREPREIHKTGEIHTALEIPLLGFGYEFPPLKVWYLIRQSTDDTNMVALSDAFLTARCWHLSHVLHDRSRLAHLPDLTALD